jgi:hypothetical protein
MATIQMAQQAHQSGLRLNGHHPRPDCQQIASMIANVGADVKAQIAPVDVLAVKAPSPGGSTWHDIVNKQRPDNSGSLLKGS